MIYCFHMDNTPKASVDNTSERLHRQHQALYAIARQWRHYQTDLDSARHKITEAAASALGVERVSIWRYNQEQRTIVCDDLYEVQTSRHTSGAELSAEQYPIYFRAMETEEIIHAANAMTDPRTCEFAESYLGPQGITSLLDAPIHAGGQLVGVLCHEHVGEMRRFHEDEISIAVLLTNMVGAAIEHLQNLKSSQQIAEQLQASEARYRTIFESVADIVFTLTQDGIISSLNSSFERSTGWHSDEWIGKPFPPIVHPDDQPLMQDLFDRLLLGEVIGAVELRILTKSGSYADFEVNSSMSNDGTQSIVFGILRDITERKLAEEQTHRFATIDSLTGILNRREFTRITESEIERAKRYGTPLTLLMYDLDRFKLVNDNFGHDVGDYVLQTVVQVINNNMRITDVAGRWGGEEFMVLLLQTDLDSGRKVAEKLRQAIEQFTFDKVGQVTASFGLTQLLPEDDIGSLTKRVDEALYEAKQRGRNRVEVRTGAETTSN